MLLSDRVTGLAIATLGGAAAYGGSRLPPVPGQQVGPSTFPLVVGLGLVACGILVALGIGRGFEEKAVADPGAVEGSREAEAARAAPSFLFGLRALLPPALLLFYVLCVDRLGFVPTAAAMIAAMVFAFGGTIRLAVPLALVAPVFVHLVFFKLLRVPLPDGLLPMPW